MELKNYLQTLMRWMWLLVLCGLLGMSGGFIASRLGKPIYEASTKILVSKDLSDQTSQFASMSNQQLIDAYVQLLSSTSVIDEASRRLKYQIDLKNLGSVLQVRTTNVIQITMDDGDPQRAAAIANMLVQVLIDKSAEASGYASTQANIKQNISQVEDQITALQTQFNQIASDALQSQLKQVNDQITGLQDQVSKLSTEIGPLASLRSRTDEQSSQLTEKQAQLAQLQSELTQAQQVRINLEYAGRPSSISNNAGQDLQLQLIQSTLDHYQTIYFNLLNDLQAVQVAQSRATPTIEQIEMATPPAKPILPRRSVYTILGGVVGLVLAIGVIFIIEYLDDTLKTPQDVQQALDIPVLGYITDMQSASNTMEDLPVTWHLTAQTSDAIEALRTNMDFAVAHSSMKTLLLLGVNDSDGGKTSMAADLAVSYAQSGSNVILVDADLQNPSVHRYFGLANDNGFSNLLADDSKTKIAGKEIEGLDGLTVITSGDGNTSLTPMADGMTKPNRIVKILDTLKKQSDLIVIDAPSINVADSWVLASKVDGVLLVIQPRMVQYSEARRSLEQLKRAGAKMLGVVLYHNPRNLAYYYKNLRNNRVVASFSKKILRAN